MSVVTIFEYLAGRRGAILEVASDRRALLVGAVLVLSAALARNYDRASLVHEPWRLLGPFVASLAIGVPLFLVLYGFSRLKGMEAPGILRAYRSFLGLYWMTAPLAWLYGIPYERFFPTAGAVEANLWTLALVSLWRVALMIRAVSVVFGMKVRIALPLVMLVADVAALTALAVVPMPVVSLMGGISPEQAGIAFAGLLVNVLGWLSLPIWILYVLVLAIGSTDRPEWRVPRTAEGPGRGRGALAVSVVVLLAWAALLPANQPEQIRAARVRQAYRDDGPAAALTMMSAREPGDFPPGWRPPPQRFPGEPTTGEMLDVLEAVADTRQADWVVDLYVRMFLDRLEYDPYMWPQDLMGGHVERLAGILSRLPRGPELARALEPAFSSIASLDVDENFEGRPGSQEALETLRRLARQGGVEDEPGPPLVGPEARPIGGN